jgi:hypothetical protein
LKAVEIDDNGILKTIKSTENEVIDLEEESPVTRVKEERESGEEGERKSQRKGRRKVKTELVPDDDLPIDIDDEEVAAVRFIRFIIVLCRTINATLFRLEKLIREFPFLETRQGTP